MQRSSGSRLDRGQVYPIPALVAVLTLTLALTAYANAAGTVVPPAQPSPAVPALKQVEAAATTGAILDPDSVDHNAASLDGYHVNVTLQTPEFVIHSGPEPPAGSAQRSGGASASATGAASASASVAVADPGTSNVVPGTLSVEVWPWTEG